MSAVDVLIIRESLKAMGSVIREAVRCLRRSLRSGSYVLRSEEQVMHERQLLRMSKKLEEKATVEQS